MSATAEHEMTNKWVGFPKLRQEFSLWMKDDVWSADCHSVTQSIIFTVSSEEST